MPMLDYDVTASFEVGAKVTIRVSVLYPEAAIIRAKRELRDTFGDAVLMAAQDWKAEAVQVSADKRGT